MTGGEPFRLTILSHPSSPLSVFAANARTTAGLPRITQQPPNGRRLAVCGGSPTLLEHLDELRHWDGDIWGVNFTARWLKEQGIEAAHFSVDPGPGWRGCEGVDKAVLATCCDPERRKSFKEVLLFDMVETDPAGVTGGTTSASRAPLVALTLGYTEVHFFGCSASFADTDHVDRNEGKPDQLIVRAGGKDYRTTPCMLLHAEEMAQLFLAYPGIFIDRCGGLTTAIKENMDTWEIVAVSPSLKVHLEELNGCIGLYEQPFEYAPC